jgi:hypothetical protein
VLSFIPFPRGASILGPWQHVYLAIRAATIKKRITVLRAIFSGLRLRNGVRGREEQIQPWLTAWYSAVATWIENEEPDYLPVFELDWGSCLLFTSGFASRTVQYLDAKLGALKELLIDLRARR